MYICDNVSQKKTVDTIVTQPVSKLINVICRHELLKMSDALLDPMLYTKVK
jgi:hypothetical protein